MRPGDRPRLAALFDECSDATVVGRFFARVRQLPGSYIDGALAGDPRVHDALVVRRADGLEIVGLASVVTDTDCWPRTGELGVLVADRVQGCGLGAALVEALIRRAVGRGMAELRATVLPPRGTLLCALGRRLEMLGIEDEGDALTGRFRLPEEVGDGAEPA